MKVKRVTGLGLGEGDAGGAAGEDRARRHARERRDDCDARRHREPSPQEVADVQIPRALRSS